MDLPDVKAGMAILAEHIQRLNAAIKQVRMRPGIGYLLKESSGGTSLVIQQQPNTGGGGGGATIPCPFQCSDASEGEMLKVEIQWGLIWQMLPTGMFPDNDPTLKLTITGDCFIYSRITFNLNTLLPTAVDFSVESELKMNTSTVQYNLIAVVLVTTDEPVTIREIKNICQQPFPSPCALASA
jgi:hypothetical protein